MHEGERGLLQAGGVSGILAGLILVPALVSFALIPGATPEQSLQNAITYRTLIVIGTALFFVASLLAIPLFIALHRSLSEASLAYASVGSVLGIVSSTISAVAVMVGSLTTLGLADVYANGSAADRQLAVTFSLFFSYQYPSLLGGLLGAVVFTSAVAIIAVGAAILKSISFKKPYGWMSIAFGIIFIILASTGSLFFLLFLLSRPLLIIWSTLTGCKDIQSVKGRVGNGLNLVLFLSRISKFSTSRLPPLSPETGGVAITLTRSGVKSSGTSFDGRRPSFLESFSLACI